MFLYALLTRLVHSCTAAKKCSPLDTFFGNLEPNRVPEISLSYLQNMYQLITLQGNINFRLVSFWSTATQSLFSQLFFNLFRVSF